MNPKQKAAIITNIVAVLMPYLFISLVNWSFNIFAWQEYWFGIWAILLYLELIFIVVKNIFISIKQSGIPPWLR